MKSSVQIAPNKHLENYDRMFRKLYKDEQLSDVTLYCKDGSVKAHKIILAACSPYFHKIFTDPCHHREHYSHQCSTVVMHGITFNNLKNLVTLIYRGNVEVPPEELAPLYQLAGEFQISGVGGTLREGKTPNNQQQHHQEPDNTIDEESSTSSKDKSVEFTRDTRYKGTKRVAVDYTETCPAEDRQPSMQEPANATIKKEEPQHYHHQVQRAVQQQQKPREEPKQMTAWARKQRKFKCDLCPSSFKRSSHLSRHQLVHTGERPYACNHCDKAFSRHDKLKNHISKNHSDIDMDMIDYDREVQVDLEEQSDSPPPFVISRIITEAEDLKNTLLTDEPTPAKRPRGRPRKPRPLGIPDDNPPIPTVKRGRGRPRIHDPNRPKPLTTPGDDYDYMNLPYGDLNYLTMPLQEPAIIEPFVQIQTDSQGDKNDVETMENAEEECVEIKRETDDEADKEMIQRAEDKIAQIGECTISVAKNNN